MTLIRVNPTGTEGGDVSSAAPVTVGRAGAGTLKYAAAYGFDRGARMGMEVSALAVGDQAHIIVANTAGLWGACQGWFMFRQWPAGSTAEFFGLRVGGAGANAARFVLSTSGSCAVQNRAGTNVATIATLATDTIYRFELECSPGSSTSDGELYARIFTDADVPVGSEVHLTGQNLAGDVSSSITQCRAGDSSNAVISGSLYGFTQIGFDTGSTRPTIPPVPIEEPPGPVDALDLNRLSWQTLAGVPGWY